jgi:hypothetical protein
MINYTFCNILKYDIAALEFSTTNYYFISLWFNWNLLYDKQYITITYQPHNTIQDSDEKISRIIHFL